MQCCVIITVHASSSEAVFRDSDALSQHANMLTIASCRNDAAFQLPWKLEVEAGNDITSELVTFQYRKSENQDLSNTSSSQISHC